jgi:hypothetical protein
MTAAARRALAAVALLVVAACKDDAPKPHATGAAGQPAAKAAAPSPVAGSWHRVLHTLDENANNQLDDAERKAPMTMDYGYKSLVIRADHTCDLERKDQRGKGTCTFLEDEGTPFLEIEPGAEIDDTMMRYRILARSDRELVFKDITGSQGTIYLYERR